MGFCSILRTLLTENLWGAAPNPALPLFFRRKAGQKNLYFIFYSEFSCWRLWHENGHGFAKNILAFFNCSTAKIAAAHSGCNFREQTSQNGKFNLAQNHVCLTAINSSSQTKAKSQIKREKSRKVSHERSEWDTLRQNIIFPPLFLKKAGGVWGGAPYKK